MKVTPPCTAKGCHQRASAENLIAGHFVWGFWPLAPTLETLLPGSQNPIACLSHKNHTKVPSIIPTPPPSPRPSGQGYLFVDLRLGHLVEVLQVRVEEVAPDELDAQHGLDDVADGAVVGQADLLCRAHEVAPAVGRQRGAAAEQDLGVLWAPHGARAWLLGAWPGSN